MRLERLFSMGFSEIAGRSRMEASKWLERVGLAGGLNGGPFAVLGDLAREAELVEVLARYREGDALGSASLLLDRFRTCAPARFFRGVSGETAALIAQHLPQFAGEIVEEAEAICRKRFDLLGYRGLDFGDPIDWHLDPVSGKRAPLIHWSRIKHLDPETVGDHKLVWELNRHQWLVRLGQAYRLTGEERYAEAFTECVRDWMRSNPAGLGINWASSLEAAFRIVSWSWSLQLFVTSRALSPEFFAEVLSAISAHAAHVERYLSYYFSPNTHLTGEALGLFYAGTVFSELKQAERWRELGARILVEENGKQFLADGVYFEQSTCYQRYTVEIYLHFLIISRLNGWCVPLEVSERVQRMVDCLLMLRFPDGSMPQIGDGDGGWLLPLARRGQHDLRGLFSTAAVFFGRPDYAWAAGSVAPETIWLLGDFGLEAFHALVPDPPSGNPSRLFAEGGYAVMRSGWEGDAHHLIFDVGPLGCPISAGHGHADLLSIQCSAFGEPYLVDPGTYCYTSDLESRHFFRCSAAHSTVVVDGQSQAVAAGPFSWEERPRARLRLWLSTETYDFADAEHDAYHRLSDPVTHRRRLAFIKPRYWVVVDDLEGAAGHRVEIRFQFAPIEVSVDSKLWAWARGKEGRGLLIKPFATVPLEVALHEGELAPIQGWVAPDYGQRRPAPTLVYSTISRLPLRILTLILPAKNPAAPPTVLPLLSDRVGPVGLHFPGDSESLIFREDSIVFQRS